MSGARPLRRVEILGVVALIGILVGFLFSALEDMRAEAEAQAVETEIAAQRIELLDRLVHWQTVGGALPVSDNPVVWTGRVPNRYLGERDTPSDAAGVWYFDRGRKVLAYRDRSGREARFRLVRGAAAAAAPGSLGAVGLVREVELGRTAR